MPGCLVVPLFGCLPVVSPFRCSVVVPLRLVHVAVPLPFVVVRVPVPTPHAVARGGGSGCLCGGSGGRRRGFGVVYLSSCRSIVVHRLVCVAFPLPFVVVPVSTPRAVARGGGSGCLCGGCGGRRRGFGVVVSLLLYHR